MATQVKALRQESAAKAARVVLVPSQDSQERVDTLVAQASQERQALVGRVERAVIQARAEPRHGLARVGRRVIADRVAQAPGLVRVASADGLVRAVDLGRQATAG